VRTSPCSSLDENALRNHQPSTKPLPEATSLYQFVGDDITDKMGDFDISFIKALKEQSWSLYAVGMFVIVLRL
jgi:hypothetical protein